jgi:sortase (surface protein transpeptidase)
MLASMAVILAGAVLLQVLLERSAVATSASPTEFVLVAPPVTTATSSPTATSIPAAGSSTSTTAYTHVIENPARIVIPAIETDALIVNVGVLDDGSMDLPPFGLAAWFHVGPAPGDRGPAVIIGHVDSKKGPDVFFRLHELERGDEIRVYDKNGDAATFVVDSLELTLKSELPTERIWNDTLEPVIRLITCGGDFDRSTGHYLSNTIVYGHLVE